MLNPTPLHSNSAVRLVLLQSCSTMRNHRYVATTLASTDMLTRTDTSHHCRSALLGFAGKALPPHLARF